MKGLPDLVVPSFVKLYGECNAKVASLYRVLLVVVGFVFEDGEGAVELLREDGAHNLVREGHLRERELAISALVDSIREAIRASNNKY